MILLKLKILVEEIVILLKKLERVEGKYHIYKNYKEWRDIINLTMKKMNKITKKEREIIL